MLTGDHYSETKVNEIKTPAPLHAGAEVSTNNPSFNVALAAARGAGAGRPMGGFNSAVVDSGGNVTFRPPGTDDQASALAPNEQKALEQVKKALAMKPGRASDLAEWNALSPFTTPNSDHPNQRDGTPALYRIIDAAVSRAKGGGR